MLYISMASTALRGKVHKVNANSKSKSLMNQNGAPNNLLIFAGSSLIRLSKYEKPDRLIKKSKASRLLLNLCLVDNEKLGAESG